MIDQENSSAWGQEGFESAAPLAYNYPLSPKPGLFTCQREQPSHCGAGASFGRTPPCGASMLGETARGYVGFRYCQSSSFGLGSVHLRSLCAEWRVPSRCERACASPSLASIALRVANSVWCLARVGSFKAASLKKLKEN